MALAATDFSLVKQANFGFGLKMAIFTWTPSGTYTSGGEDLTDTIAGRLGFKQIHAIQVTDLVKASDGTSVGVAFDHNRAAPSKGKFRVRAGGVGAHTHDIKAIGGLTSSEPIFLDASQKFGKNAATDRTIVGSTSATTGGVVATTAGTTSAELAAGTDLTAYRAKVMIWGT